MFSHGGTKAFLVDHVDLAVALGLGQSARLYSHVMADIVLLDESTLASYHIHRQQRVDWMRLLRLEDVLIWRNEHV